MLQCGQGVWRVPCAGFEELVLVLSSAPAPSCLGFPAAGWLFVLVGRIVTQDTALGGLCAEGNSHF